MTEALDAVARIIDPDAWWDGMPADGCGAYWIGRRNKARTKAEAIAALYATPPAPNADLVGLVKEKDRHLMRALVLPMVRERSREPGDAWHQAADALEALSREGSQGHD